MSFHDSIETNLKWQCPHCGHQQKQAIELDISDVDHPGQTKKSVHNVFCGQCAQRSPVQVTIVAVDGVDHPELPKDRHRQRSAKQKAFRRLLSRWLQAARHPSMN